MIKKLLLIFWEIVPKTEPDGRLKHEMILVCDAYRKDLQHPNEFIRGATLRFLCKLKEPELLGMISHKKSLITIFGLIIKSKLSSKNLIFFIKKISTAFDFGLYLE